MRRSIDAGALGRGYIYETVLGVNAKPSLVNARNLATKGFVANRFLRLYFLFARGGSGQPGERLGERNARQ